VEEVINKQKNTKSSSQEEEQMTSQ